MYNEQFVNVLIGCIMSHIVIGTLANRQIIKLLHMNRICNLFGIKYPIIQGGMVWCSGWRLASAVSNAGGLGLIGAGSMHPETLREHIQKCKAATDKPFGVNIPLMYPEIDILINMVIEEGVKIVFTSAGNPKTWTEHLHEHGIIVAHVVASTKFAAKCEEAGVDAIVAEGFEAGGHNGREGDLFEGELEIGQVASCIHKLQTVDEVMKELVEDFNAALNRVNELKRFI